MISLILFLFTYIIVAILGETITYRILKRKESKRIPENLIQAELNLSADELDAYILKLANIRLIAASVALYLFVVSKLLDLKLLLVVNTLGSYFLITMASIIYLRIKKEIKVPKPFFLLKANHQRTYYVIDEISRPISSGSTSTLITSSSIFFSDGDFKPMEMSSAFDNSFSPSSSFQESFQSSSPIQPAYYGTPGYDSGGIYTGSSTAIGGISN